MILTGVGSAMASADDSRGCGVEESPDGPALGVAGLGAKGTSFLAGTVLLRLAAAETVLVFETGQTNAQTANLSLLTLWQS